MSQPFKEEFNFHDSDASPVEPTYPYATETVTQQPYHEVEGEPVADEITHTTPMPTPMIHARDRSLHDPILENAELKMPSQVSIDNNIRDRAHYQSSPHHTDHYAIQSGQCDLSEANNKHDMEGFALASSVRSPMNHTNDELDDDDPKDEENVVFPKRHRRLTSISMHRRNFSLKRSLPANALPILNSTEESHGDCTADLATSSFSIPVSIESLPPSTSSINLTPSSLPSAHLNSHSNAAVDSTCVPRSPTQQHSHLFESTLEPNQHPGPRNSQTLIVPSATPPSSASSYWNHPSHDNSSSGTFVGTQNHPLHASFLAGQANTNEKTVHDRMGENFGKYARPHTQSIIEMSTFQPSRKHANSSRPASVRRQGITNETNEDEDEEDELLKLFQEEEADQMASSQSDNRFNNIGLFARRFLIQSLTSILWIAIIVTPGLICQYQSQNQCVVYDAPLIKYSLLLSIIVLSHFVANGIILAIMVAVRKMPVMGPQLRYYARNLSRPLKWAVVAVTVQVTWPAVFINTNLYNNPLYGFILSKAIICTTAISISFLVKSILMRLMAIRFHRGAYDKRIRRCLLAEYVILKSLFKPGHFNYLNAKMRHKSTNAHWWEQQRDSLSDVIPITEAELLGCATISNYQLGGFIELIKDRDVSFQRVLTEHGEHKMDKAVLQAMSLSQLARLLSARLFHAIKGTNNAVSLLDFRELMSKEISEAGFLLFHGSLDESDIFSTMSMILLERRALRTALNDAESAINRLGHAATGVLYFVLFIAGFLIFNVDPGQVLLTTSSFLLASAFAIGDTAKSLLQSILFIFSTHPFDIGDRVMIDGALYTITKINLLSTQLIRYDNAIVFMSNAILSTKAVVNLRRSPDQFDIISLQVSFYTSTAQLRDLESRLAAYLKRHSSHYYRRFEVEYKEVIDTNKLTVRVWVQHRGNFHNMRKFRERRGRVLLRLKRICEDVGIEYSLPAQTVFYETFEE